MHVYYINYVRNFKLPGSTVPIKRDVQESVWTYLQIMFSTVWIYFENKRGQQVYEGMSLKDVTSFTGSGIPIVAFSNKHPNVMYDILIEYWLSRK